MPHTPGPWLARKGDVLNPDRPWGIVTLLSKEECESIDGNDAGFGERSSVIAEVYGADKDETTEADARLLAAAPDLLSALSDFAFVWDGAPLSSITSEKERARVKAARAAISKATGG